MTHEEYQVLEERLARIEEAVQQVKELLKEKKREDDDLPWWQKIAGSHKDDPVFAEIVRLGKEIREAERPQNRKQKPVAKSKRRGVQRAKAKE